MGYITPNSFLKNTSYKPFREYLKSKKQLTKLIDFKSYKVFDGFSTYTAISIFDKENQNNYFYYQEYNGQIIETVNQIYFQNLDSKKWNLSSSNNELFIKEIFMNTNSNLGQFFDIQYGVATLRDKIFIGNKQEIDNKTCIFHGFEIEQSILKKIVKGSRCHENKVEFEWIIFPYKKKNNRYVAIDEYELQSQYHKTYQYLLFHKEELQKRDIDKGIFWYEFGRSQGIQSSHKDKIVVNPLVNGKVHYQKLKNDILVYSGIFITQKKMKILTGI